MKIALLTDTHFGARNDSLPFDNYFRKFYSHVFFPTLERERITTVIHLGDVFDRRKYINFNILKNCREYFFDELEQRGMVMHLLAGNHDTYFKNTNEVNSPDLLLTDYNNIQVIDRPTTLELDHTSILMLPWICSDNYAESMQAIEQSTAPVLFGHLELAGFVMHKGVANDHGMETRPFEKFDLVCSGHFHHRSRSGNIQYLGNTYELTWNDFDDPRGFHIFDTKTLQLEFIVNPYTMFERFVYDDAEQDPDGIDVSTFAEKNIKVIVANKTDFGKFDRFVDRLYKQNPLELKIIEDFSEFEASALDDDDLDLEDTMSMLDGFVDGTDTDADKERIKTLLRELYVEAQNAETA